MKAKKEIGFLTNLVPVAHIDLGIAFALKQIKDLFLLTIVPASLSLLAVYLSFYYPLKSQQRYLLLLLETCATVWLLVSVALYTIYSFQNSKIKLSELLQNSFVSMPKVIICTITLSFITVVLVFLFIFLAFLFWAPMFCAFELAVKPSTNEKYKLEDDLDDDEDVIFAKKKNNTLLFAQKSIFDLGLSRSVQFVTANYIVTFELLLLSWFLLVVPAGLIFVLGGGLNSFPLLILKTLISYLIFSLISAISAVVLLFSLSKEALAEISVNPEVASDKFIALPVKIKFHRNFIKWLFLILLGVYFTKINFNQMVLSNNMPKSVSIATEGVEFKNNQLILKLHLEDKENNFRWFDPQKLRISLEKEATAPQKDQLSQEPSKTNENFWNSVIELGQEDDKYLRPARVMPYTESGEALDENNFAPYNAPVKLVLYFIDPPAIEDFKKYHFKLYHQLFSSANDQPILEGKLSNE